MDLRKRVTEALESSPSADPALVAAEIARSIPANHVRDALAQALPQYVVALVTRTRNLPAPAPVSDGCPPSTRWAQAADVLAQRVWTGDTWKHLRDCTADDLLVAAANKRHHAAGVIASAERYEALAATMIERGATTVADLGDDAEGLAA